MMDIKIIELSFRKY